MARAQDAQKPLRIAVLDPLSHKLACACVKGTGQRRYDKLAEYLSQKLGRPVQVAYGQNLGGPIKELGGIDLAIGKDYALEADLKARGIEARRVARLTDRTGSVNLNGYIVVRADSPIKTLAQLRGRTVILGPEKAPEKHAAALAALAAAGVDKTIKTKQAETCTIATAMLLAREADAAAISSYAEPLIYGCGTAKKGALRIIGRTAPVPFIAVFEVKEGRSRPELQEALMGVGKDPALTEALESRSAFDWPDGGDWSDFRGKGRAGQSDWVPDTLPNKPELVWKRQLSGPSNAGVAATSTHVIVGDKDATGKLDVFRCLNADTGEQLWRIAYPAAGKMDNTNAPRATAVVSADGKVYTLGAFGDLCCTRLDTGHVVWRRNLAKDYHAKVPTWGYCSTPLLTPTGLIANPGAADASMVALDASTGKEVWRSPGGSSAYASLVKWPDVPEPGSGHILGFDTDGASAWEAATGRRLQTVKLDRPGEFLVPSPVAGYTQKLVEHTSFAILTTWALLAGENNGARLHRIDSQTGIDPQPVATNPDFAPDTVTPVECEGLYFGGRFKLMCLDENLKTCWTAEDPAYDGHYSLIAGNKRVLVLSQKGTLSLIEADRTAHKLIGRWQLPGGASYWSHPAIVRNRLYVRSSTTLYCYRLR